jgi:hypothetical protein
MLAHQDESGGVGMDYPRSIISALILSVAVLSRPAVGQDIPARQQAPQRSQESSGLTRTASPEVQSLLNDSEGLPPEFSSDVTLALVENGFIRNDALKAKLLTRAFEEASAAQDDVLRGPFGVSVEETSEGLHAIASLVTRLNRISLQARVIHELVATDPRRARRVFESMQPPQLTPVLCNENWYFVPDSYYDALAPVLQRGFSDREIAGGNRAAYLSSIIRSTRYHVQLVPLSRLLSTGDFTEQELRTVVPVYAAMVAQVDGDPLAFSILLSESDGFFEAISALLASLDKRNVDSRALLQAFRDYMVLNVKGPNCGATELSKSSKSVLPPAIVSFNETFRSRLQKAKLDAIGENEIRGDTNSNVKDQPLPSRWKSPAYFQLLEAVQGVNLPLTGSATSSENDSPRLSQAQDVLSRLNAWTNEDQPEVEFFHQKAILLEGLARRTIGTSLHAEVLDSLVHFLEQNSYQEVTPIDWFFCAKRLLSTSAGPNKASADLRRLVDSREPVLSIYARLQSLLQSSKEAPTGKYATGAATIEARE